MKIANFELFSHKRINAIVHVNYTIALAEHATDILKNANKRSTTQRAHKSLNKWRNCKKEYGMFPQVCKLNDPMSIYEYMYYT